MSSVEEFRIEVRGWLRAHLTGEFAAPSLPATGAHGDPYDLDDRQRLFLFSRADTIHAGSDEIRRTLIAERILGLPKEVRA